MRTEEKELPKRFPIARLSGERGAKKLTQRWIDDPESDLSNIGIRDCKKAPEILQDSRAQFGLLHHR
jgi:hypothetical protein